MQGNPDYSWNSITTPVSGIARAPASASAHCAGEEDCTCAGDVTEQLRTLIPAGLEFTDLVCIETYPGELPPDQARASIDDTAKHSQCRESSPCIILRHLLQLVFR
jgi:hypothetical protein